MSEKNFASIILETNIEKPLDYSIPAHLKDLIKKGMIVEVPLRGFLRKGYVLNLKDSAEIAKTLPIQRILSDEVINEDLFQLGLWMTSYYCASLHKVFKCMVPTAIRDDIKPKMHVFLSSTKPKAELLVLIAELVRSNPKQAKILEIIVFPKTLYI